MEGGRRKKLISCVPCLFSEAGVAAESWVRFEYCGWKVVGWNLPRFFFHLSYSLDASGQCPYSGSCSQDNRCEGIFFVAQENLFSSPVKGWQDCSTWFSNYVHFCLQPLTEDLGITRVVVVVLVHFHLSRFLFKRNWSEINSTSLEIKPWSFGTPAEHSINWATATLLH